MNKQEFLDAFLKALEPLSPAERQQITEYYDEYICDGMEQGLTEEECVARFGDPVKAAAQFREASAGEIPGEPSRPEASIPESGTPEAGIAGDIHNAADIHRVVITAEDLSIHIQPGPRLDIRYQADPIWDEVDCWAENGVLTFRHRMKKPGIRGFFSIFHVRITETVEVFVPSEWMGAVEADTRNGSIKLENLSQLAEAVLTTHNSAIIISSASAPELRCSTTNSAIRLQDVCTLRLEAKTSNGGIEARQLSGETLWLKTSNAGIRLQQVQGETLDAATSNGKILAEDCTLTQHATLTTSNSKLEVQRLDSREVSLHTSNSKICGTLVGAMEDYAIESGTSNAPCNLPAWREGGSRKLTAATSNGSIQLNFIP